MKHNTFVDRLSVYLGEKNSITELSSFLFPIHLPFPQPTPPFAFGPVQTQNNGIISSIGPDNFAFLKDDGTLDGEKLVEFENLVERAYEGESTAGVTSISLVEWIWAYAKENPGPHIFLTAAFAYGLSRTFLENYYYFTRTF